MQFEIVAEHLAFPEGPVVMPDGSIIVVEIGAGRVTRIWGEGRTEVVAATGGGPNGAALGPDGAIYVCNSGAIDQELGCHLDHGPDGDRFAMQPPGVPAVGLDGVSHGVTEIQ